MYRVLAALSLSLLAACVPGASTRHVWVDSYYRSTVNGEAPLYNGEAWVYDTPAYTLRYTLGTLPDGIAPASLKFELNTKRPLTLVWSQSSFVYPSGRTSSITHEGVRYGSERVPDTELPAGYNLVDRIVPRRNLLVTKNRVTGVVPLADPSDLGSKGFTFQLVVETPERERLHIRLEPYSADTNP